MAVDAELDRWLDAVLAEVDADYRRRLASAPPVIVAVAAALEELARKDVGNGR